tara:strand:- start:518 stop:1012 length:495 start_codon:yes stop_codon:yes gene_type:complete
MPRTILNNVFRLFFISFLISCERDDICLETTAGSPNLIILLLDSENNDTRKIPTGFLIRAIGSDNVLTNNLNDSIVLPLNTKEKISQFEFIINFENENENIDTLLINYKRIDKYINRACGYRSNFILEQSPIRLLNPGDNWIKGFIILKDTISDETTAHLGILH